MNLKYNTFWVLLVLAFFKARTQEEIKFTSISTKDGLSSNLVKTIIKDKFGLLWFGTEDGLNKFDGSHVRIYRYKKGDSTSLQSNEILSLHEDKGGNLWVGTSGGSLSLYDRKKDAFINFPAGGGPDRLSHNVIRDICSDYRGKIWIVHFGGVDILDPNTRKLVTFPLRKTPAPSLPPVNGMCGFEDSKHRMWIGTTGGLFRYDPKDGSLKEYLAGANEQQLPGWVVNDITEDNDGNIWVATTGGLSRLNKDENSFITFSKSKGNPRLNTDIVNTIAVDKGQLWLGTSEGLEILDVHSLKLVKYSTDSRDIHSLTAREVKTVYIDNQGICWIGTFRGGVNKYDKNLNLFNFVKYNAFDSRGLNASTVSSFVEYKNGNLFVGTEGGGLSLFNTDTRLFTHYDLQSKRKDFGNSLSILALAMNNKNQLMVGAYSDGLFIVDPETKKYQQFMKGDGENDLNSSDIFCIKKDRNGKMWIGTNGEGVNVMDENNKVIRKYTPNPKYANDILLPVNGFIRDIEEDDKGNIWIGTHGGGIAVLQPLTGNFTVYTSWTTKLPNDKILSLFKDRHGNIWAGTSGSGLVIFKHGTGEMDFISETDKLENNTIYTTIEDNAGLIWVTTNKGISSVDYSTRSITNYNYHNGVQNNNFNHKAGIKSSTGELFFGGLEGINYFNPKYLRKNNNIPAVLITDLRIANQSVLPSEQGPIHENISVAREINLDYKQNFALSFVGLNFTSPEQNQYAYKLEGFDNDWNYIGNSTTASYTNLDPGEYTFRVKASNNNGVWNNTGASIKIFVNPPFWKTPFAYVLYGVVFIFVLLYLRYRSLLKLKKEFAAAQLKNRIAQERKEAERVHELDMLKIKFFTNLSHEFRTPISLILGPVDKLILKHGGTAPPNELNMIRRNAKRLLNLVNQLLDFRKMEEQELKLQPSEGDLITFLKELADSFQDLSERKKIDFTFKSHLPEMFAFFDHDKIERIIFNLLSNAFKFTPEGGRITLEVDRAAHKPGQNNWVTIKVTDTGIGIPEDKQDKIFENFFQNTISPRIINHGSGIGLAITREFVKLHGGTIEVESEPEKGSIFSLHLPFDLAENTATEKAVGGAIEIPLQAENIQFTENGQSENGSMNGRSDLPSVLLVEDNEDFRFYLKDNLRLFYNIIEASNGKEGWQKTLSYHPQLIVSDVNMPLIDGIEFTKKLKLDKRTSHIPVILLTALSGEREQEIGLETGANDYITKPFNFEILKAKIKNLLLLNATFKSTYSKQIKIVGPDVQVESDDQKFLKDIVLYLEENLTNSQLSVEELSRHLGMSRSTLYNKILETTGQTPVEFIRNVKLDKAAVLLEKSDMNIAQIAYSTGFSTPNYFAKSFKTRFNMLPSEYVNQKRKSGKT